jgi:2-haloacid dehalogenase
MITAPGTRAVIFDVGNVLYDWNLRQFFEKLVPAHELELFLRDVVTLDWHNQHDAGRPFAETSAS